MPREPPGVDALSVQDGVLLKYRHAVQPAQLRRPSPRAQPGNLGQHMLQVWWNRQTQIGTH